MADEDEHPTPGSPLDDMARSYGRVGWANCTDFALTLLKLIAEQLPDIEAREFSTCLATNTYDCHTMIEVLEGGRWVVLDPYFGIVPHNADGSYATHDQLREAVRAKAWSAITYQFFTPDGDKWVRRNYLDWPLYFVNTYDPGIVHLDAPEQTDLSAYYVPIGVVAAHAAGVYALGCEPGAESASATWDGTAAAYPCNEGVTHTRAASTVLPDAGAVVLEPQRFVFPWDGTCNVVAACESSM